MTRVINFNYSVTREIVKFHSVILFDVCLSLSRYTDASTVSLCCIYGKIVFDKLQTDEDDTGRTELRGIMVGQMRRAGHGDGTKRGRKRNACCSVMLRNECDEERIVEASNAFLGGRLFFFFPTYI